MKQLLLVSMAAMSLAACGATPQSTLTTDSVKTQVVNAPKWFFTSPSKPGTVYSAGTAVSPDLQLTVDLAVLNAKSVLADRLEGQMSSLTKTHVSKVGNSTEQTALIEDYQKTTTNLIDKVDLSGYTVAETEVTVDGPQYRAFVLLSYDSSRFDKFNRATVSYRELQKLTTEKEEPVVQPIVEKQTTPNTVINVDTVVNTTEDKDDKVTTVVENTADEKTN